jgi:uncharacterized protein (DUF1501 family)
VIIAGGAVTRISRRTFVASLGHALAWSAVASAAPRVPARPWTRPAAGDPRYFFQIMLGGGIDAIYSFDPKERAEVEPRVDVPYASKEIVTAGNVRLGPHVRDLAPWADRFTIVRGVSTRSAAHIPAMAQLIGGKLGRAAYEVNPTLCELIGVRRDSQAVAAIAVGGATDGVGPRELSHPTMMQLLALAPEELAACARVLEVRRRDLARGPAGERLATTLDALDDTLRLLGRLEGLPRPDFFKEDWSGKGGMGRMFSMAFQMTLWLFEHDLAKSVRMFFRRWDTHFHNTQNQTKESLAFFPALARFLRELEARRLLDATLVMMGSELGRYPELNPAQGKHHLPEASFVLMGKRLRPGVFGATGRRMEALPVDLRTGRPTRGGAMIDLDDLGATVLAAAGIDPARTGYHGRPLGVL